MAKAVETALQLEVIADKRELMQALNRVIGVVERKTTIPILANLLIETSDDEFMTISATNLDQAVKTTVPVKVRCGGTVTVPARKLYEYVKLLSGDEVVIRQEENNWIYLRCGRSKTKMVGMDRANFPLLPAPTGDSVKIDAELLRTFIKHTLVSVSKEEYRYTLNGALLTLKPTAAQMVSTDGHRLTLVKKTADIAGVIAERNLLIPAAGLKELYSLISAADERIKDVELWETEGAFFFQIGETVSFSTRKLTGKFPNYEAVLPKYEQPGLDLDVATMAAMLARCLIFSESDTHAVAFSLSLSELMLSSAAKDLGSTDETVEIVGGPETPIKIGFNGDYLQDLFESTSGSVELKFKDASNPSLWTWRTDDGLTLQYIVMPLRLGDRK